MSGELNLFIKSVAGSEAQAPSYESARAAGMDLRAWLPEGSVTLESGSTACIPTGWIVEIPAGYEGQVRPRSGLALKHGVTVLNAPGTIDSDYRGEVRVILINHSDKSFIINNGERIAQLVIAPVVRAEVVVSGELSDTERGGGGFGSTGK